MRMYERESRQNIEKSKKEERPRHPVLMHKWVC